MRKTVITVLIMIPVLAVLFVMAMRWLEPRLIYFPGPPPKRTPADAGLRFEDVQFPTQDGHTLKGWWLPAREADAPVMLYFHGNAGTREDRLEILQGMMSAGISVFIFDYRGYGGSSGRPSEAGLILDGEAAFDWLDGKTNGGPIFLLGHSLGAAVAAQTALTRKSAGLILESAFTSVPEMARRTLPLPQVLLRMLVKTQFDNRAALRQYKGPLLILHGDMDEVVPFWMGGALFEEATASSSSAEKRFQTVAGGHHNDILFVAGAEYWRWLREFAARALEARKSSIPK